MDQNLFIGLQMMAWHETDPTFDEAMCDIAVEWIVQGDEGLFDTIHMLCVYGA